MAGHAQRRDRLGQKPETPAEHQDEVRQNWDEAAEAPDSDWDQELQKRVLEYATGKIKLQTNPQTWACFEKYLLGGRSGAEVAAN